MTEATAAHHQTSDESIKAERGGHVQNIRLEIPPDKLRWQSAVLILSLAVSISAFGYAWQAEREARLSEYYAVDLELCILKGVCPNQLHVPVPKDPFGHAPK